MSWRLQESMQKKCVYIPSNITQTNLSRITTTLSTCLLPTTAPWANTPHQTIIVYLVVRCWITRGEEGKMYHTDENEERQLATGWMYP